MIKEVKITAEASVGYQKFCVEFTAEVNKDEEFKNLKSVAIKEAKSGVEELLKEIKTIPEYDDKKKVNQQPSYQNYQKNNSYQTYQKPSNYGSNYKQPRLITEGQVKELKRLNYQGNFNLTFDEASSLIQQLRQNNRDNGGFYLND